MHTIYLAIISSPKLNRLGSGFVPFKVALEYVTGPRAGTLKCQHNKIAFGFITANHNESRLIN
jgi:hypothetical protein